MILLFMFLRDQSRSYLQLTVACIKMNRPEIAERAVEVSERRIQTSVLNTKTPSERGSSGNSLALPDVVHHRVPRGKAAARDT